MYYNLNVIATICQILALLSIARATREYKPPQPKVVRPRGVPLELLSLYQVSGEDASWTCLDNSKTIRFVNVNDDYCDCVDGSDEPGTSACIQGKFYCENYGHKSMRIPSSRVNDGICDCCDGSDEYREDNKCTNTCEALGRAEEEKRRSEAELHKKGAARRAELISKGKQMRAEREAKRAELSKRLSEQEAVKAEKEALKAQAEAAEAEALELYKEQQREQEAAKIPDATGGMRVEAEASFVRYDTNKDGFIEVTELQVDLTFDRDRNGVVTVEEAKYFLDERERMDLEGFVLLSWPRIKPVLMIAEGLFKPPQVKVEGGDVGGRPIAAEGEGQHSSEGEEDPKAQVEQIPREDGGNDHKDDHHEDGEEEEQYEEDEEPDVGVGEATAEHEQLPLATAAPNYDPETQRLIDIAQEARNAFSDVERAIREIENEIKDIDEQNAKDYGYNEEFAALDGACYKYEDREYVYTLCPFDRASQKQRSGGSETTLGRWDQWLADDDNKYARQKYAHGASCWNGPQRSAVVQLRCALEERITGVSEPNRCEYFFEFETPAACAGVGGADGLKNNEHDEL